MLETPLYATLTAFGASSLFVLLVVTGYSRHRRRELVLAGVLLGFLVLTRLELAAFAVVLVLALFVRREAETAGLLLIGLAPAGLVWLAYNQAVLGTPLQLGILRGDINRLAFDPRYIFDALLRPESGVLFWSPLLILGVVALPLSRFPALRILGLCSLVVIGTYLLRVPVMYGQSGGGMIDIGGILVSLPSSQAEMHELVRSDMNRYVTVLMPGAVLGLRDAIGRLRAREVRRSVPRSG